MFYEIEKSSELIFGTAKHPLNHGFGLKVEHGEVIPEIKFFPKTLSGKDPDGFKAEVQTITKEILDRAVELGVPSLQIETELTFMETRKPKLAAEITNLQKSLMEKYFGEYGLKTGLRITVADMISGRGLGHLQAMILRWRHLRLSPLAVLMFCQ